MILLLRAVAAQKRRGKVKPKVYQTCWPAGLPVVAYFLERNARHVFDEFIGLPRSTRSPEGVLCCLTLQTAVLPLLTSLAHPSPPPLLPACPHRSSTGADRRRYSGSGSYPSTPNAVVIGQGYHTVIELPDGPYRPTQREDRRIHFHEGAIFHCLKYFSHHLYHQREEFA